jgi:hypothetical protein
MTRRLCCEPNVAKYIAAGLSVNAGLSMGDSISADEPEMVKFEATRNPIPEV